MAEIKAKYVLGDGLPARGREMVVVLREIDGRFAELMAVRRMILLNVAAFVETKHVFFPLSSSL